MNTHMESRKSRCFRNLLVFVFCFGLIADGALALDPDPLQSLKDQVYTSLASAPAPTPSGYTRDSYLETIDMIVDYFRGLQQPDGRIFDPYANREVQYATAYYALCGSVLYSSGYRTDADFLETVSLSLDRATWELRNSSCADGHSNFFTMPCMIAYLNLRDHVDASRRTLWETNLTNMSSGQYATNTPNWNLTASCGEYLRYIHGFTTNTSYMQTYIDNNMPQLTLEGLYRDGGYPYAPMAYDGFARLNFQLLLLNGYGDTSFPGAADMPEYIRRGAFTSLLMQSPWGESPIGGRSAQHQWNETEMCFIYEAWATQANAEGDAVLASAFKRAAHLAYSSLLRWVRPNGSVWIVKNHMDPSMRFGYESYSYLSQYNMWTAGFLSLAYMYADESVAEGAAPTDIGGYAFAIPDIHRGFANCGGLYLEIDMDPEDTYNSAGLVRMHKVGVEPRVCPSASTSDIGICRGFPELGMGVGWYTGSAWTSLAELSHNQIGSFTFAVNSMSASLVDFTVSYYLSGVSGARSIVEHYSVTPTEATVNASVNGSTSQTRMRYAAFLYDGLNAYTVGYGNGIAQTKLGDSLMTMELTSHPSTPFVRDNYWVNSRNGYLEAIEGIVDDTTLTYVLRPELDPAGTLFIAGNQYTRTDFSYYSDIPEYTIVSSVAGSQESSNPKEDSYDNSPSTRWASTGTVSTSWIEYDFGQPKEINQVFLDLYNGSSRTYPLRIEVDGAEVWSGWTTTSSAGWTQAIPVTTGQVVRITLTANNSDGNGYLSIIEAKIGKSGASDTEPPSAPTGLVATAGDSRVSLDWDDNSESDLSSYSVYRSTASGGSYSLVATSVGASAYVDNTAVNGTLYYYVVTAVDVSGNESETSGEASVTPEWPARMLVAHYAFDSTAADSSGNGNDAVASGSPAYATGLFGNAIDLDGSDDMLTLPAGVADSSDITIAAWVNWDGGDNWQRLFDFGNNTTEYMFLSPSSGSNTLRFSITTSSNSGETRVETSQLAASQWVHVAVTLEGNVATLYVDSVPEDSLTTVVTNPSDFSPVNNYLGRSQWSSDPFFNGRVEDFRIYNYALSGAAISALANGTQDVIPPAAPVGLSAVVGDGCVRLDWEDNSEPDLMRYDIARSSTSGSGYEYIYRGASSSEYVDGSAISGETYYYVVTAVDTNNNESGTSNEALAIRLMHDSEPDGDVDLADYLEFVNCLSGPGGVASGCEVFDADADGDIDLADFASFQWAFTGTL